MSAKAFPYALQRIAVNNTNFHFIVPKFFISVYPSRSSIYGTFPHVFPLKVSMPWYIMEQMLFLMPIST